MSSYALFSAQYPPHLGGVENFTQGLAHALADRGERVVVVTNDTEGVGEGLSDEGGVDVLRLPCLPLMSGRLPLPRGRRRLVDALDDRQIDGVLVNARFYPHSLLGMRFARSRGLTPVVLDHGSAFITLSSPALDAALRVYERVITRLGRRYEARYYGISRRSVEWLETFGIHAEGVIPNAINAAGYRDQGSGRSFRSELRLPRETLVVAFVGRLVPEKGVPAIIEASRDERLREAGMVFVLAGDGPLADEVRAAEGPCLRWVGRLGRPDTAALLGEADLLCLPSRSEGFCTTLLEAAACGCPPVVTDVGGAREVVPTTDFGRMLADARPETIVRELLSLRDAPEGLAAMGRRCCERVETSFGWDATARAAMRAMARAR